MAAYNAIVYAAATAQGDGNAAKRMRLSDESPNPSRVLHLRGLPNDTTEAEITTLTQLFGHATNIILTRGKNQALVEMSDLETARQMVEYYQHMPARIRSQSIHVQFSTYERLRVDHGSTGGQVPQDTDSPHTILRVIVDNMLYPVTLDCLYMLFSKYGTVLRIITFTKNNSFQALIEFGDSESAQNAKMALNGQNVYNGCCALHIDFSKLQRLSVRYNNDKSRDYTNNQLGNDPQSAQNMPEPSLIPQLQNKPPFETSTAPYQPLPIPGEPGSTGGSAMGPGGGIWGPYPGANEGYYPGANMGCGYPGMPSFNPMGAGQMGPWPNFGGMNPQMMAAYFNQAFMASQQQPIIGSTAVVLVSNLEAEKVTPDALFMLFGVYGDVLRVKILFNKKDTALIQFVDAAQAHRALINLDHVSIFGKQMKLSPSKHSIVQMPKEGTPDAHLTQDYTGSPLHRFRNPQSKNHLHIAPPKEMLHVSNIPPNTSEEEVREWFGKYGTVVNFKFFEKDSKMALVQMNSTEEAIMALIGMHSARLRVSFSKSTINPPAPSMTKSAVDGQS